MSMKKIVSCLLAVLILTGIIGCADGSAEDAVSSATVKIDRLPDLKEHDNAKVLVAYFSVNDTTRAIAEWAQTLKLEENMRITDQSAADLAEILGSGDVAITLSMN